ncbi:hypothetical protein [Flavobacterium reichenbachii]|uniref:Lipoprotein n=1 Tax=Flavobacterium reichenbachii TaxID=362418 RepID=A0A085ZRL3_9FLAO|nr:hypothetical protein [Flavobacterium reichenbachii]KFF07077.1 hypothetical protein IW19_16840 [Flavobacterium reichenbachii]OXB13428.1 hypothetical protein B0A68_16910 [Flavobacterium reichenbachii]
MKNITGFFLSLLLVSCHQKNETIVKKNIEHAKADTLDKIDIDKTLFSVYDLSKTTTAIVVNLDDSNTNNGPKFDEIFNQVNAKDSLYNVLYQDTTKVQNFEYYDTLGSFKLIRNKTLEREIKKIVDKSYYVYGTKGFSKVTINEVVCGLDECRTNFIAFPIENFDTAKNGKPVFCSKQLLKINYQKSYFDVQKKVLDYEEILTKDYDYKDDIKTKIFANIGDAYVAYKDDFMWGKDSKKSKCNFAGRAIYIVKKDKPIKKFWADGLDLFGIPCD